MVTCYTILIDGELLCDSEHFIVTYNTKYFMVTFQTTLNFCDDFSYNTEYFLVTC
jgi:hypothetical protein